MASETETIPERRRPRGRPFAQNNPGRPRGSRNASTLIRKALPEGADQQILAKAWEQAMAGDTQLLKFFASRLLPRDRLIKLDVPKLEYADDAVEAHRVILAAVCEGNITPSEGDCLTAIVNSFGRAIDMADLVKRIETLETGIGA